MILARSRLIAAAATMGASLVDAAVTTTASTPNPSVQASAA